MTDVISIKGAREHNLKNISIDIPRDKLVVLTGLSGSGKSSLAFNTIYAEGQRRYIESLSAYARQFLGQMDKPDIDSIDGLSPSISIDQKSTSKNPRSTVGTITEIYDYLRLLYARIGHQFCPKCNIEIGRQSPQDIVDSLLKLPEGLKYMIVATVIRGRKGEYGTLIKDLTKRGFQRLKIDNEIIEIVDDSQVQNLARYDQHTIAVIVDRIAAKSSLKRRLTESVEAALELTDGFVEIEITEDFKSAKDTYAKGDVISFSKNLVCTKCKRSFEELAPRSFSFNSPYGACKSCSGIGTRYKVDESQVVPNPDLSIIQGAIVPWARSRNSFFRSILEAFCLQNGIPVNKPFKTLTKKQKDLLYYAENIEMTVKYRNRYDADRGFNTTFNGIVPWLEAKLEDSETEGGRESLQGYMKETTCDTCNGNRLNQDSLAVKVNDFSIADLCLMSIDDLLETVSKFHLTDKEKLISDRIFREIVSRLNFLDKVGLYYLSLGRSAGTLAGGEAQRIRLASQIGSGLVGVLYVLDEPSIGLHQRDNQKLIDTLIHLRDIGNTVLVVEHDEETIRVADYVIDIGPGAGEHGGEIIFAGTPKDLEKSEESITGQYLNGIKKIEFPKKRRKPSTRKLKIIGATENNLKNLNAEIPLEMFVAVTGVSGSGKSTLINDILYKGVYQALGSTVVVPGRHKAIEGIEYIDKVIDIDQSPIGRTPRSNPATYTGVFSHIRTLFSQVRESRVRGYQPGRFSFNVPGGRCEACEGDGTIKIEMHFLPDVYVPCEVCGGSRFNRDTLEIMYHGKNIADVLNMPIQEAIGLFEDQISISRYLETLMEVGLGYIKLGQSSTTLSGGEAQRVKLASELARKSTGSTLYILDEPTTGLHMHDVAKLISVLSQLVDNGNTVVVIEHNLDVIKCADWILDLGPEGGNKGGKIVAKGTPEKVAQVSESYTGLYLKKVL